MQFSVPHCSIAVRSDLQCLVVPQSVHCLLWWTERHWAGHCRLLQLSPVKDNAALSPSAVDPLSRPSAVLGTRWVTVRGAGTFCAQIPSAGTGDTLNCMRALLGTVQHFRLGSVMPESGSILTCGNGVTGGRRTSETGHKVSSSAYCTFRAHQSGQK